MVTGKTHEDGAREDEPRGDERQGSVTAGHHRSTDESGKATADSDHEQKLRHAWAHARNVIGRRCGEEAVSYWFRGIEPALQSGSNGLALLLHSRTTGSAVDNIPPYIRIYITQAFAECAINVDEIRFVGEKAPIVTAYASRPAVSRGLEPVRGYNFGQFLQDESNQEAYHAARRITEPAQTPLGNHLVIYGPYGVGKTHLLHAIANAAQEQEPYLLSADLLVRQYVTAAQGGFLEKQIREWRLKKIFLIDDLHFLIGREATQRELILTLEVLQKRGSRIVMTLTQPPTELRGLDRHLLARLSGYVQIGMGLPGSALQQSYLRQSAAALGLRLDEAVIAAINSLRFYSLRELGGVVRRLAGYADLLVGKPITPEDIDRLFAGLRLRDQRSPITIEQIQKSVSRYFRISVQELCSKDRRRDLVHARHVALNLSRKLTDMPLLEIGRRFGGRDAATVVYSTKVANQPRQTVLHKDIAALRRQLEGDG